MQSDPSLPVDRGHDHRPPSSTWANSGRKMNADWRSPMAAQEQHNLVEMGPYSSSWKPFHCMKTMSHFRRVHTQPSSIRFRSPSLPGNLVSFSRRIKTACKQFILGLRVPRPPNNDSPKHHVHCRWIGCVQLRQSERQVSRPSISVSVMLGKVEGSSHDALQSTDAGPVFSEAIYNNAIDRPLTPLENRSEEYKRAMANLRGPPYAESPRKDEPELVPSATRGPGIRAPVPPKQAGKPSQWISKLLRGGDTRSRSEK